MLLPVLKSTPLPHTVLIAHRALEKIKTRLLHTYVLMLFLLLKSIATLLALNVPVPEITLIQKMTCEF